jgi:exodeoxyribonuclease VII small subunit
MSKKPTSSDSNTILPIESDATPTEPVAVSYEAALAELETLVEQMEGGQLDLESSLAAYRRGSALLKFCQGQLAAAEQQVKILEGENLVDAVGGNEPF